MPERSGVEPWSGGEGAAGSRGEALALHRSTSREASVTRLMGLVYNGIYDIDPFERPLQCRNVGKNMRPMECLGKRANKITKWCEAARKVWKRGAVRCTC